IYGIQAASLRYFSKPCTQLLQQEAALLVGMLKAPSRYHPVKNPDQAKARRNTVFAQMEGFGAVEKRAIDSLSRLPIELKYNKKTHHDGLAPHFREHLRADLAIWCRQYGEAYGKKVDLYRSGLRITTSIHSRMQHYAEAALKGQMKILQGKFDRHWEGFNKFKASKGYVDELISRTDQVEAFRRDSLTEDSIRILLQAIPATPGFSWSESEEAISLLDSIILEAFTLQAGMIAMDPTNGHIRAWVGGIDHRYSAFDQVLAARQTGSVFKPLLYVSALEKGEDPCMYISNERETYEDFQDWTPRNSDNFYGGQYSMEGALTHSVNVVSARLIMKIGIDPVLETAKKLGIRRGLPHYPAIALGAADIPLKEVVSAYATLANGGKYIEPKYIVRIEDREGKILADYSALDPGTRVVREESATMLTEMLEGVVNKGTGRALRSRHKLKMDLAGKTGTTQNQRDGWFVAYNPALVVGARVGGNDPRIHWRSLSQGQGATTALPIVGYFLQATTDDPDFAYLESVRFPPLSEEAKERLDCADFTFPMGMSEFKLWWRARSSADSLLRLGLPVPDSIRILLQNDWVD
ncbi:MAG: penicillin-binding transpeptidase domain-containing protein, partial [Bacteroidia bacterium]|nr:penicillin-binding transpeptidase domain-containing protein [Bacteroidia bacterium]